MMLGAKYRRIKLDSYFSGWAKMLSEWVTYLNVRHDKLKLLWKIPQNNDRGKIFLNQTLISQVTPSLWFPHMLMIFTSNTLVLGWS